MPSDISVPLNSASKDTKLRSFFNDQRGLFMAVGGSFRRVDFFMLRSCNSSVGRHCRYAKDPTDIFKAHPPAFARPHVPEGL